MEKKSMTLDYNEYVRTAVQASAEGIVLLRNEGGALPLEEGTKVSVFGRIQLHYYRSGTGSGGMVNVRKVTGITDALLEDPAVEVNRELLELYTRWEAKHPFIAGEGWGTEPWSQEEMPLTDEVCRRAAEVSDAAIVVIGRTAGEDRDNVDQPGAYRLSATEYEMLKLVRNSFDRMIVLLNTGGLIDLGFCDDITPDALAYVWQGGMLGGLGAADVLTGRVSPSGHLTDTIAVNIEDYPSDPYFGGEVRNVYTEDIYVGYRYFETAAKDKVRYPFGFGLTYTSFDMKASEAEVIRTENGGGDISIKFDVKVSNTGSCAGRHVVQVYVKAPAGMLGKPERVLAAFAKTAELRPEDEEVLSFNIPGYDFASFDDTGRSGYSYSWVLEKGTYEVYAGDNVRDAQMVGSFALPETICLESCSAAMMPEGQLYRMAGINDTGHMTYETLEYPEERMYTCRSFEELEKSSRRDLKLKDVTDGKCTLEEYVAALSDEELMAIARGEGMGSARVTPGTAAAFGGVTEALVQKGIPAACCDDGPSGMRLDCGQLAFSLPNGTMLASTFDVELNRKLFAFLGMEMTKNQVDNILGPGMNIHRHPLNGRNFEYFSEDPYLTGTIGAAQLSGLKDVGASGTVKHFCCNNQEKHRSTIDSIVSMRALREIYLKGYEIAQKKGSLDSVMTSYGLVNGKHAAGNYDLTTGILRDEWNFDGIVMTDWWAMCSGVPGKEGDRNDMASMINAGNNLYMVVPAGDGSESKDNLKDALQDGRITRGVLQHNAIEICRFVLETEAMRRAAGLPTAVTVENGPDDNEGALEFNGDFVEVDGSLTLDLADVDTSSGSDYLFGLHFNTLGYYRLTLSGVSDSSEEAQMPVSMFFTVIPLGTMTFTGSRGEPTEQHLPFRATTRDSVFRMHFAQSGLKLKHLRIEMIEKRAIS